MKSLKIFFVLTVILFVAGCGNKNNITDKEKFTTADSLKVAQEVLGVIDAYTQAHNNMDAQKAADFFVNSPELMVAENGELYPNWDTLAKMIKDWYATAASAKLEWENRKVLVLSFNSAAMTGKLNFKAVLKNKKNYAASGYATFVLVKQNNQWKIYLDHESYKSLTK